MSESHIPADRCRLSEEISLGVWRSFQDLPMAHVRFRFSMAAILLAHEHHSAIVALVRSQRFASATTLLRPLLEALATAAWSLYAAKVERLKQLMAGVGSLPDLNKMLDQAEAAQALKGRAGLRELMRQEGRIFHDFTHGEVEQLKRRFGIGAAATTYELRENYATLMVADVLLLCASGLAAAMLDSKNLDDLILRYFDAVISDARLSHPQMPTPQWDGWSPLLRPSRNPE